MLLVPRKNLFIAKLTLMYGYALESLTRLIQNGEQKVREEVFFTDEDEMEEEIRVKRYVQRKRKR